jgi:triosephosphate isomerase
MNHTLGEAEEYVRELGARMEEIPEGVQPFVIPPFTALDRVARALSRTRVLVGVQNVHWETAGGWTGEIAAGMARDAGAAIAEIGHSERRTHFGETDASVNRKVHAALAAGLRPLVCVGEPEEERSAGTAPEYIARQVKLALRGVPAADLERILLAYEPIWAIGEGGTPATPAQAEPIHAIIRQTLEEVFGDAAAALPVLYGGSVNAGNAAALLAIPTVDGLFVGRAAWSAGGLLEIVERCCEAARRQGTASALT